MQDKRTGRGNSAFRQGELYYVAGRDSVSCYNAILWVKKRQCKTKLERNAQTEPLYQIIERAERWLQTHNYRNPIIKWETQKWGEVPADFGRK